MLRKPYPLKQGARLLISLLGRSFEHFYLAEGKVFNDRQMRK